MNMFKMGEEKIANFKGEFIKQTNLLWIKKICIFLNKIKLF